MLAIDLGQLEGRERPEGPARPLARPGPWHAGDERWERAGSWSGSALAVAILLDALEESPQAELPFVVAIGDAVRRGLPTAARATVAGRAPLSGLYADGQVGGELGRRLASFADALVLRGRTELVGAVLHLGPGGEAELISIPELCGLDPRTRARALRESFGVASALCVGPAARRDVLFASLANGEDPPSFVGRGGLGAAFARLGLEALVVAAPPVPDGEPPARLFAALGSSPRLLARSEGGTMELLHAFGARGDLRARNYSASFERGAVAGLSAGAGRAARERRGCRNCPTPCGWVFERPGGERQGARFSAVYALGPNLGLADFGQTLEVLAACDRAGVDAKEAGAALAILALARERGILPGPSLWGDTRLLCALIDELAAGEGEGTRLARGARALALELGLEQEEHGAKGQAARPELGLAVVLGQCVSSRGPDPMRIFPFLGVDGADRERLEELLDPLGLPPGAEDPLRPEGKGRLVWWHENLALALDASGFCAFSAAGLLADDLLSLDDLAAAILPRSALDLAPEPGRALLAMGASIALLQRELCRRLGAPPGADRPAWAEPLLELPGMWDEYQVLRGLDEQGRVLPEALERVGREALLDLGIDRIEEPFVLHPRPSVIGGRPQVPGRCTLRGFGSLGGAPARETRLLLQLPARLEEVLDQLGRRSARGGQELRELAPGSAVYRAGRRLAPTDWVEDGDELDLVLAISGG